MVLDVQGGGCDIIGAVCGGMASVVDGLKAKGIER